MNIFSWLLLLVNISLIVLAITSLAANKKNHVIVFTLLEGALLLFAGTVLLYRWLPLSSVISLLITIVGAGVIFSLRKITEQKYL